MKGHKAQEDGYWAEVPALPDCVSQGKTTDKIRQKFENPLNSGWKRKKTNPMTRIKPKF